MSDLVLNRLEVVCSSVMRIENEELHVASDVIKSNSKNSVSQDATAYREQNVAKAACAENKMANRS